MLVLRVFFAGKNSRKFRDVDVLAWSDPQCPMKSKVSLVEWLSDVYSWFVLNHLLSESNGE